MKRLAILGAGSWGTALAVVLAPRFSGIRLWAFEPEVVEAIGARRENTIFLPGFTIPDNVEPTGRLEEAVDGADCVLGVMPSQFARRVYAQLPAVVPRWLPVVSATKGLERGSLLRMSQVIGSVLGPRPLAVLSGPTFAREIANREPAAVVLASEDDVFARQVQTAFSGPTLRLYTNADVAGVETGAAIKNVIAIAAGVCQGLGLGSNSQAALITRGLAEITRLAVALGGKPRTLAGLAGLGDLVLTCSGQLSRNRSLGVELAGGRSLAEITGGMKMVAEGVETTYAAVDLARRTGVDMPITHQVYEMLANGRPPREALAELMARPPREE
ncbi:MAG: NAD(P)-dependent glycerol-3-phosphate dehydrogenase [Acidobacteria bacterium]|nr:NAD(P)-dependent glycerol-3-phosphate dehydrogenase [Acidobacteriota bacterium]